MHILLSRRNFLFSLVAGLSATLGGGWWAFSSTREDPLKIIAGILKKNLPYLKLEERGVTSFSIDFYRNRPIPIDYLAKWGWIGSLNTIFEIFDDSLLKKNQKLFEENIVQQYLMSSDFFFHDADESRIINYLGYFDPYNKTCTNPFARFSDTEELRSHQEIYTTR